MKKHLLNAALLCSTMIAFAAEPVDVTPSGLNFDSYDNGAPFKLTANKGSGWSADPLSFDAEAFKTDGQLTIFVARGATYSQEEIDANLQSGVIVHEVGKAGKCLVISEQWSPTDNGLAESWGAAKTSNISNPQFNFYFDPSNIKTETDKVHYLRVRLVYTALFRGCHYLSQNDELKTLIKSIYATDNRGWVIPEKDDAVGTEYAEDAANFAKWVGETGKEADIPENPEIYVPVDGDKEPWDVCHGAGEGLISADHKAAYLLNAERFRVYEFDVPVTMPNAISVQVNTNRHLGSYIFKEIKFTDLGTDEADATLLGKRKLGWTYFNEFTSGIENIVAEDAAVAPTVYYNLQGVEVKNPAAGIYIVRRGNKVTKELVR